VLLRLADELSASFAIASDKALDESIDLRLESLGIRQQWSEAAYRIPGRGVALLGEAEEESFDRIALQSREFALKLVKGAWPESTETGKNLPFAGRGKRSTVHAGEFT